MDRSTELTMLRQRLEKCAADIEHSNEELEELHLIREHRKAKALRDPSSHNKARHLMALERIEVVQAGIDAVNKTKELTRIRLKEIVGEVRRVIKASHSAMAEAAAEGSQDAAAPQSND